MLKIAFVGCGVISGHHIEAIAAMATKRIVVTAVIDPNEHNRAKAAEVIQQKLGDEPPEQFESLAQAASADPFHQLFVAVDIMVPSLGNLHETVAVEALELGYHCILEKPISNSLGSASRILEAVPSNLVLMIAENSQYWHEVVTARNLIREGAIGDLSG